MNNGTEMEDDSWMDNIFPGPGEESSLFAPLEGEGEDGLGIVGPGEEEEVDLPVMEIPMNASGWNATVTTPLLTKYFRNEKKLLHCFPVCEEFRDYKRVKLEGLSHSKKMCSGTISSILQLPAGVTSRDIKVTGRFVMVTPERLAPGERPIRHVGETVSVDEVAKDVDSGFTPPVFSDAPKSAIPASGSLEVRFSAKEWKFDLPLPKTRRAQDNTEKVPHYAFEVVVYLATSPGLYTVKAIALSAPFQMASLRTLLRQAQAGKQGSTTGTATARKNGGSAAAASTPRSLPSSVSTSKSTSDTSSATASNGGGSRPPVSLASVSSPSVTSPDSYSAADINERGYTPNNLNMDYGAPPLIVQPPFFQNTGGGTKKRSFQNTETSTMEHFALPPMTSNNLDGFDFAEEEFMRNFDSLPDDGLPDFLSHEEITELDHLLVEVPVQEKKKVRAQYIQQAFKKQYSEGSFRTTSTSTAPLVSGGSKSQLLPPSSAPANNQDTSRGLAALSLGGAATSNVASAASPAPTQQTSLEEKKVSPTAPYHDSEAPPPTLPRPNIAKPPLNSNQGEEASKARSTPGASAPPPPSTMSGSAPSATPVDLSDIPMAVAISDPILGSAPDSRHSAERISVSRSQQGNVPLNRYNTSDAYLAWIPPFGLIGIHHLYLGRYMWFFLYLCTFGLLGVGWVIDGIRMSDLVRLANENRQKQLSFHDILVLYAPPFGLFGAHRFAIGTTWMGFYYLFTIGGFGVGYVTDGCRLTSIWRDYRSRFSPNRDPTSRGQSSEAQELSDAYIVWCPGGIFGLHHLYLGDTTRFLVYFFTIGVFGIGFLLDFCRMPVLVRESRKRRGLTSTGATTQATAEHDVESAIRL